MFIWILAHLTIAYLSVILVLHIGFRRLKHRIAQSPLPTPNSEIPLVSVVIAARNEEQNIPGLLRSLASQEYPRDRFEIIIVDDRSEDATWSLLEDARKTMLNLRTFRIGDQLPGYAPKKRALDAGIRASTGEILLLTDADCTPPPTWISSMLAFYREDVSVVAGYSPYRFVVSTPRVLRGMLSLDCFAWAAVAAASAGLGQPLTATGTNLSYRRRTYLEVGGFEPIKEWISGDDDLFMRQVAERSEDRFSYALDPASYVPTIAPRSLKQFWHQRIRFGSKGRHHRTPMTVGVVIIYLLNVMIVGGLVGSLLGVIDLLGPSLIAWAFKSLGEFLFLRPVAAALGEEELLLYFLPTALVHPLYVSLFGFLGLFGAFRWKESQN